MAELQYVGGLVIPARKPRELARWYSETFGILMGVEHAGGIYGGFRSGSQSFHFGIVPYPKGEKERTSAGIGITFHVDDFAAYVAELRERGLEPVGEVKDEEGAFAVYRDPEGNELTIWGEST